MESQGGYLMGKQAQRSSFSYSESQPAGPAQVPRLLSRNPGIYWLGFLPPQHSQTFYGQGPTSCPCSPTPNPQRQVCMHTHAHTPHSNDGVKGNKNYSCMQEGGH